MATELYDGPVCYFDGWHYTVVAGGGGDVPGARLVLEDDGSYRIAAPEDTESWHDRKHAAFTLVVPEGGVASVVVSAEEMVAVAELLAERRGG